MKIMKNAKKSKADTKIRPVPMFSIIIFAITAVCGACHIMFYKSAAFADAFNQSIGRAVRLTLSKISGIFPFSVMEYLLFASPVLIVCLCVIVARTSRRGGICAVRCVTGVLSLAALVYCLFAADFAPGYRGTSLADKLSLTDRQVSAEELYQTTLLVIDEVNSAAQEVDFPVKGSSTMPYDNYGELSRKLCDAYGTVCDEYSFIDRYSSGVKPLVISKYMTYTHISGIYGFFTGDANINTNFPDYICVYTAAHEMAHQRGISREDEANFTAFLVCRASSDPYIRYSGLLNMYEYLSDALYKASPELYTDAASRLCIQAKAELRAYSLFFDKYRDNKAADVSDSLNNSYLESQGTAGTASYGMVVDLAVAYYLD